jgi:Mrp family chromosome partitioning ATPase
MRIEEGDTDSEFQKNIRRTLQDQDSQQSIPVVKHKFLMMSCQGGVGKTSVVVNLALTFAKKDLRVGLMDLNFYSPDIHRMLGLKSPIVWNPDKPYIPMSYSDHLKVASMESVMQNRDEADVWVKPPKILDFRRFISSVNWGRLD